MNENINAGEIPKDKNLRYKSVLVYPETHKLVQDYCLKEGLKMSAWVDARVREAINLKNT